MGRIKQMLLDELESRLDDDEAEPYSPPSPATEFKDEANAEVSSD